MSEAVKGILTRGTLPLPQAPTDTDRPTAAAPLPPAGQENAVFQAIPTPQTPTSITAKSIRSNIL